MMKKDKNLAAIAASYPEVREVFETSDGLIHLTLPEAEAQAKHLPDAKIETHSLPKPKPE